MNGWNSTWIIQAIFDYRKFWIICWWPLKMSNVLGFKNRFYPSTAKPEGRVMNLAVYVFYVCIYVCLLFISVTKCEFAYSMYLILHITNYILQSNFI